MGSSLINVKDFGAKGNGSANDFKAIKDAIDESLSVDGPAEVFFPAGHYIILSTVNINTTVKDLHLHGTGYASESALT